MTFDPTLAEIRFGCGRSPLHQSAQSVEEIIARLHGPDHAANEFPIPKFNDLRPDMVKFVGLRKQKVSGTEKQKDKAREQIKKMRQSYAKNRRLWLKNTLGRRVTSEDGFRERLHFFWADHFTARSDGLVKRNSAPAYWEEAIRPHLTGNFRDMLIASVTHPLMLSFLDQRRSFGPNSEAASKRKKSVGLNENLAREVMELHTLGVNGPYTQKDVRQLAELFTGLSFAPKRGFLFRKAMAEPGEESILGKRYGGDPALLQHVHEVLSDLARHPSTARHICWKLAVHFVADQPDLSLVDTMTQAFLDSDGELLVVYKAMLEHPAAWSHQVSNVKQPIEFVSSALRALAVSPIQMHRLKPKLVGQYAQRPLKLMGQDWDSPLGPDGWAEHDANWVTPQAMAVRMQWSLVAPQALVEKLPDPRAFVQIALDHIAPDTVKVAAKAAESRWEGVALVLASPAFQRR